MKRLLVAFVILSSSAFAQQWSDVKLVNPIGYVPSALDGLPASSINPNVLLEGCNAAQTTCAFVGLNIQSFEETSVSDAGFAHLGRGLSEAKQLGIIAAAMKDAIPNDGDRFALRLNMATWQGSAAGSVSFSANISNSTRISADYGRSQNENMFSGGVNFSFH